MRYQLVQRLALILASTMILMFNGVFVDVSEAQGSVHLRQPFAGIYRVTAYVDHRSPDYTVDGNVVVHNGEDRLNCPGCGNTWTTQGPYCYDGHNATDYALPGNTPVLAAASGIVTFRGWRSQFYGNSIRIDHGGGYESWYSHLAGFSVNLNEEIASGEQIGLSGNTGQGQPFHLHFEVHHNGIVTDPFGWQGDWADPLTDNATCLWADGKCSEIVIEDESAWFDKSGPGTWPWSCQGNGWTMRYITNIPQNLYPNAASWRPDLPYQGPYHVYAFIPGVHGTTTNARYFIFHKNGSATVPVSQINYSDYWVDLGSYEFWDGNYGYVYLDNVTGEPNGSTEVSFDSVKFVQFRTLLPVVLHQ